MMTIRVRSTVAAISTAAFLSAPAFADDFSIRSNDLANGFTKENVLSAAAGFGCDGNNRSPAVSWSGAPKDTRSLVLTIFDKDAPTGSGFWHWVVIDIPPTATELPRAVGADGGGLPKGARQTATDLGAPGYAGPCPPVGSTHDYTLTLTALDVDKLPVDAHATPAVVGFMTKAHALATATMTVRHGR